MRSALALASLFAWGCASVGPPSRDLTLRRVVLYQNGVGYFERAGVLKDERLRLRLREREMDDVLKTLVVVERSRPDGAKASTVTALLPQAVKKPAEAHDPEDATWIDLVLSPHPRGELSIAYAVPTAAWKAAYRVVLPDEKAAGAPRGKALLQAWALVDNVSDEDWTDIDLTLATGAPFTFSTHLRDVRFVDRPEASLGGPKGATGPVYAERTSGQDRDGDGVPDADDACPNEPGPSSPDPHKNGCPMMARVGEQEIRILHQVQFPPTSAVVPPAARPVLDEIVQALKTHPEIARVRVVGHASAGEKNAYELSGIRANAVRAYLVKHGVDPSRLVTESFGDARPIDVNTTDAGRAKNRRVEFQIDRPSPVPYTPAPVVPVVPVVADAEKMRETAGASALPQPAPGTLRYDITHPITLPEKTTTMVTIVNEYVPGEDVLLFRPEGNAPGSDLHPFRAARIENTSGFGFQAGPAAIFGGGTFVGEGLIDALGRAQVAFIPYGLDADATVRSDPRTTRTPVRILSAAKGALFVEDQITVTTRYHVTVGDRPPARLFVRHARLPGYEPEKPNAETETTDSALLVPVAVGSGWKGDVSVEERRRVRDQLPIMSLEAARLTAYLDGSQLAADVNKKLREMVTLRAEVDRLERESESLRARLGDLAQRSAELRESLKSIEKTPRAAALQQKLLDRLNDASKQSDDLSRKLADDGASLNEARARLAEGLRDLSIEENR